MNSFFFNNHFIGIIAVSIALFICACNSELSTSNSTNIHILDVKNATLNISEIAKSIEYIPLSNDSLLQTINKVVCFDEEYFVVDNKSKFLHYTKSGNLINQIGKRGFGPGEYRYIWDFVIQPITGKIYIQGGKPDQLMVFSHDGKFIKTIKLSQKGINSFEINNNNLFLFYLNNAHNEYNIELLDLDGKLKKRYRNKYEYKREKANVGFSGECLTYEFGGKLHFKEIFSDTLFYMDGQKMIPKLILDSEERRFSPRTRTELISAMSKDRQASSRIFSSIMTKYVIQRKLLESTKYLFFSYDLNKESQTLIFNKIDGTLKKIDSELGIINDLDGGPKILLRSKKDDNTVFSWINAIELKEYVASKGFKNCTPKYPEKKKELEKLANSLDENDNPVLMLVKLKE